MRGLAACFAAVIRTKFGEQMAYRSHFFLSIALLVAGDLIVPLITVLVYKSGASFPGWTLHEAMLIQAIFALSKGIAFPFFFGMIGTTLGHVREGTFDLLLLKPRPVLFMSMLYGLDVDDFGRLFGGAILFGYALSGIKAPTAAEWLHFALMLFVSLTVLASFSFVMSALLFKWVGSSRVYDIFDAVTAFGMYPGTIFAKSFQNLLTYVMPIALIAFIPAQALLGQAGAETWLMTAAALLFLALTLGFWHRMLRHYTSAGG